MRAEADVACPKTDTASSTTRRLADGECALVLADPPYEGVVSAQWDRVNDYMAFSRAWLREAVRVLRPGGALLVYGSPERSWIARLTVLLQDELGMELVQNLSWVYNQGGGSRVSNMNKYAVQHELLIWFQKPGGARTYNAGGSSRRVGQGRRPRHQRVARSRSPTALVPRLCARELSQQGA